MNLLRTNVPVFLKMAAVTLRIVLIFILALSLYFVPAAFAMARRKRSVLAIFAANLIFGWTLIGWGVALVWALTRD